MIKRPPLRNHATVSLALFGLCLGATCLTGCGQAAKVATSQSAGDVDSYFGGPFAIGGSNYGRSTSSFDHTVQQISVSALISAQTAQVPSVIMAGTFKSAANGFLSITENFATAGSGTLVAENPPVVGAWAVEIPGSGALANLLNLRGTGGAAAAPSAMAEDAICPTSSKSTSFVYVTTPKNSLNGDTADYGVTKINIDGSDVIFNSTPFLIGSVAGAATNLTGGCSDTNFGALTAYPENSFGSASNIDLVSIGATGLMVSSFSSGGTGEGVFGGGTGVVGVSEPSAAVDLSAVVGAKYNGFFYDPLNHVAANYDITQLASSFGDYAAGSSACSLLQSAIIANNGQGAKTVATLPGAHTLYGGEFVTGTGASAVNDPTAAGVAESCDTAIDLGAEDSANHGLFPHATVFIGSGFPPFSSTDLWNCPETGSPCAVSFPAAAVVGQVSGQYVIFVAASPATTPAAQIPDASGIRQPQPVGIYLFQRSQ